MRPSHFIVFAHGFLNICMYVEPEINCRTSDVSLSIKSFQRNGFDLLVSAIDPRSSPSSASQPAKGGGEAGQVCGYWPPSSDGGDGTKGFTSGTAAEGTGSKVQGVGRPANSDPESGAEGGSEPQRGSAEPGGAGQPRGHTCLAASTRGGEQYLHTITLLFVLPCHIFVKSLTVFDLRDVTLSLYLFAQTLFLNHSKCSKQVAIFITDHAQGE